MHQCICIFLQVKVYNLQNKVCIKPTKLQKEFKIIIKCNFFVLFSVCIYVKCGSHGAFLFNRRFQCMNCMSPISFLRYSLMLQKESSGRTVYRGMFCFFFGSFFFCLILHACVMSNLGRQGLGCV